VHNCTAHKINAKLEFPAALSIRIDDVLRVTSCSLMNIHHSSPKWRQKIAQPVAQITIRLWVGTIHKNISCIAQRICDVMSCFNRPEVLNVNNELFVLYSFFWVIPQRLDFICRRFGTLCLFHLHRRIGMKKGYVWTCRGYLYGKRFGSKIA